MASCLTFHCKGLEGGEGSRREGERESVTVGWGREGRVDTLGGDRP